MGIMLTDGVVHGDVPLERDAHGHEDGRAHADGLRGVEQVREQLGVELGAQVEAAPEGLEDGAEQEERVEADQGDQQKVEAVAHLVSGNKPGCRNVFGVQTMVIVIASGLFTSTEAMMLCI